jgi:hypothetical protein
MTRIIKEPFAPRRRRPMVGAGEWSRGWSWLDSAVVRVQKLADASREDFLHRDSFGLLVTDHPALALGRLMTAVVSRRNGKEKTRINSASLESHVR